MRLSVASSRVLQKMAAYLKGQMPPTTKHVEKGQPSDMILVVEMEAYDRRGPAYSDHQLAKSVAKGMLSLGLAPSDYKIIADFDVKYSLKQEGRELISKAYKINDSVKHQKGDFEKFSTLDDYSAQMLEKHMVLTLTDFLKEAAKTVPAQ